MAAPSKRSSSDDDLLRIVRAKDANRHLLLARPNVVGLDVGFRKRGGTETKERVIKVYVSQKVDESLLGEEQRIPRVLEVADGDVGVDVEQRRIPRPLSFFTLRGRPLRGGMSISGPVEDVSTTGTLGICVTLNDQTTYILSNNHILAGANTLPLGTPIIQPSQQDGGAFPNDLVALLSAFVPLDFGSTTVQLPLPPSLPPETPPIQVEIPNPNSVDAALARVIDVAFTAPERFADSFNVGNRELHWIGYPRPLVSGRWTPEQKLSLLGARVCKMGRTSEFTMGTIVSPFADLMVGPYLAVGPTADALFVDQLQILGDGGRPFSEPGDSGSLVVTFDSGAPPAAPARGTDAVGLLFAAELGGPNAWANPLDAVLDELDIPQL